MATNQELLDEFREIFSELDIVEDDVVEEYIKQAKHLEREKYAILYWAAHYSALSTEDDELVDGGATSIAGQSLGKASVSLDGSSSSSGEDQYDFNSTSYGRKYQQFKARSKKNQMALRVY